MLKFKKKSVAKRLISEGGTDRAALTDVSLMGLALSGRVAMPLLAVPTCSSGWSVYIMPAMDVTSCGDADTDPRV